MKIAVINGTEYRGCTYRIKEIFLETLRDENTITEFYLPKDGPDFCIGCKNCFLIGEQRCPHADKSMPIWQAILDADLLVFAYPVYALRTTGQMKTLLDHFCCHWMVHRPNARMFTKRAVILTQSIGAPNGAAQRDVATSLRWMGVSDIRKLGFGLMEGIVWKELSEKRRETITRKTRKLASHYTQKKIAGKNLQFHALFAMSTVLHRQTHKAETETSLDNQHWIDNGWMQP